MFITAIQSPSQGQSYEQSQWIQQCAPFILGLVSGLIVGWWGHFLTGRRDDRNRAKKAKADFGIFISRQFGLLPQFNVKDFYSLTKPSFNSEIHGLRYFLTENQRARLDRLWKEYDEIPDTDLSEDRENEYGSTWGEGLVEAMGGAPVANPKHPRDVLKNYFDEFNRFCES